MNKTKMSKTAIAAALAAVFAIALLAVLWVTGSGFGLNYITNYITTSAIERQFPQFRDVAMDEVEIIATTSEDEGEVLSARHYLGLLHLSDAWAGPEKAPGANLASVENLAKLQTESNNLLDKAWNWADGLATVGILAGDGVIPGQSFVTIALYNGLSRTARSNWSTWAASLSDWTGLNPDIGETYWGAVKTTRDAEATVWVWRLASETGYAESKYWLGQAYHYGYGVEADKARATKLICTAAEKVDAAKYACAEMQ